MAKANSTRRPAGSSLSPQSADAFDDLFRRLLVAVSHIKLVSQHFGDLSSLSLEDAPAGMTLYEAAQDLDALYGELDAWYAQHEHRPKIIEATEPSVETSEESDDNRTAGQRLYDDVAEIEGQLKSLMDEIPYESLGDLPEIHPTAQAFLNAEIHLQDAVAELRKARDAAVLRFEALKGGES